MFQKKFSNVGAKNFPEIKYPTFGIKNAPALGQKCTSKNSALAQKTPQQKCSSSGEKLIPAKKAASAGKGSRAGLLERGRLSLPCDQEIPGNQATSKATGKFRPMNLPGLLERGRLSLSCDREIPGNQATSKAPGKFRPRSLLGIKTRYKVGTSVPEELSGFRIGVCPCGLNLGIYWKLRF